jgi:hypothetical protein
MRPTTCLECGEPILRHAPVGRPPKFCSRRCGRRGERRRYHLRHYRHKRDPAMTFDPNWLLHAALRARQAEWELQRAAEVAAISLSRPRRASVLEAQSHPVRGADSVLEPARAADTQQAT